MGNTTSSYKVELEQKLRDYRHKLTKVMSKSNSMEKIDKDEIIILKVNIRNVETELNNIIEDEDVPSF